MARRAVLLPVAELFVYTEEWTPLGIRTQFPFSWRRWHNPSSANNVVLP